jgi:hypothetical protein
MTKWLLAAMLAPCLAPAQMTLYVASQTTERAVGDYYDVGTVAVNGFVETAFRVRNSTSAPAWLTGLNIGSSGNGIGQFTFKSLPQLPVQLAPGASIDFAVRFSPSSTGSCIAYLNVNGVRTVLTGAGREPEYPRPEIVVSPAGLSGGIQARVSVRLASEAKDPGAGELSLEFIPSPAGATDDPAVLFLAGARRTVNFAVQGGRDIALFSGSEYTEFQTGTTAGSIRFTAKLGPHLEQLTVTVPSAAVVLDTARLSRSSSGVEVQLAGFDTSRTACRLGFTFFDRQGREILPGEMQVDASQPFHDYFAASRLGGMFTLRAVFAVHGDASQIGGVDVYLLNSYGTTRTARLAVE